MAEDMTENEDRDQILASLANIQRSIDTVAAEQHDMYNLIKGLRRSDVLATLSTVPEAPVQTLETGVPLQTDSSQRPQFFSHRDLAINSERTRESMAREAIEASLQDLSNLDPSWPTSLEFRAGLEASTVPASTNSKMPVQVYSPIDSASKLKRGLTLGLELTQERKNKCVILPTGRFRLAMDALGVCLLASDLIITPLQLAWNLSSEGLWSIFALIVCVFWTFDMCSFFLTAFYTWHGEVETRLRKTAARYLRQLFFVDLAIVTCDWLNIFAEDIFPDGLSLLRTMKLTRLLRILRVINVSRFERIEDFASTLGISTTMIESIKILTFTTWLTHVMSCVWFAIGNMDATDTGLHWLDSTWVENAPSFADSTWGYQYTSALQWSMTTMLSGSSSIEPQNSWEQLFSCACILVGLLLQAFVVSVLSSAAVEQKARQRNQTVTMSHLNKFCSNHKVHSEFWLTARSQVKAAFARTNNAPLTLSQVEGLQKISITLRMNILFEVFEPHLSRHNMFLLWSQADTRTSMKITNELMGILFAQRGHAIFMAGEKASGMYLLSNGSASYSQSPESSKSEERVLEVTLDSWVCEAALWMFWLHVGTMEAASYDCEVQTLRVDGFLEIIATAKAAFKPVLCSYAMLFYERVIQSVPPAIPWPNDLQAHGTSFAQLLISMHESVRAVATSLALDSVMATGSVDETQKEILKEEIGKGEATLTIAKTTSSLSLQRVVSVARVFVSRSDNRLFVEIGKWSQDQFVLKPQYPGAKQKSSEDVFSAVRRVVDRLKPSIGHLTLSFFEDRDEIQMSNKVKVNTRYYFFDAWFSTDPDDRRRSTHWLPELPRQGSNVSELARRRYDYLKSKKGATNALYAMWNATLPARHGRSSIFGAPLEERLLSEKELFWIQDDNSDVPKVCMWLSMDEMVFLQSREGAKLVESIADRGGLQAAPPMINTASDNAQVSTAKSSWKLAPVVSTASAIVQASSTDRAITRPSEGSPFLAKVPSTPSLLPAMPMSLHITKPLPAFPKSP